MQASSISALMTSSTTVTVRIYPNQKPWITGNIRNELKGRASAFKERDSNPEAYKKSRYVLRRIIKQAKRQYRTNIESNYNGCDSHRMWQGLQTITDYSGKHSWELPRDTSLPDELNYFYARFKANNTETCMRAPAVPEVSKWVRPMQVRPLNRSTFRRPQGQTDYQDVYCEHALTNWQVSSRTFSTSPCLSL